MKKLLHIMIALIVVAGIGYVAVAGVRSYQEYQQIAKERATTEMAEQTDSDIMTTDATEKTTTAGATTKTNKTVSTTEKTTAEVATESSVYAAYKEFLERDTISEWGNNQPTISMANCKFALISFDHDEIPELVLYNDKDTCHADGYYQLYKYVDGQVVLIENTSDNFQYYKEQSVLTYHYAGMGVLDEAIGRVSGTSVHYFLGRVQTMDAETERVTDTTYYAFPGDIDFDDTNKISEEEFDQRLQQTIGDSQATSVSDWHENTAKNREAYLK